MKHRTIVVAFEGCASIHIFILSNPSYCPDFVGYSKKIVKRAFFFKIFLLKINF